jgi:DNA primase
MPFVDFAALKAAVNPAAETLGLILQQEGSQFRSACPACKQGGDRAIVLTPAKDLFYCFSAKKGGDCIGLAAHVMGVGNNDAANLLADQLGTVPVPDRDTVQLAKSVPTAPQKPERRTGQNPQPPSSFDPQKFAEKTFFHEGGGRPWHQRRRCRQTRYRLASTAEESLLPGEESRRLVERLYRLRR